MQDALAELIGKTIRVYENDRRSCFAGAVVRDESGEFFAETEGGRVPLGGVSPEAIEAVAHRRRKGRKS